jgi:glutamyl-tRNA reductase
LNRLLPTALRAGKRARAETEIGVGTASVASAAVGLAAMVFGDLTRRRVLVVGAGATARLAAQHFAKRRPAALRIANRTPERAASLAAELGGEALGLEELPRALARSDVVVCATASPAPLIDGEMVRGALRDRPRQSLVILDLAVPRNVEPAVANLENVFLHAIDAVQTIVDLNLARRRRAIPRVEAIVEQELEGFFAWLRSLETTPTLRALRERFEAIRAEEVRRHGGGLTREDADRLERLTKSLVNKLLHGPTTRIKACDPGSPEGSLRLDAVRDLFGLGATDGGEGA